MSVAEAETKAKTATEAQAARIGRSMDSLLSMGFSEEIAAQALAATGGKSVVKATEWILNHRSLDMRPNKGLPRAHARVDHYFQGVGPNNNNNSNSHNKKGDFALPFNSNDEETVSQSVAEVAAAGKSCRIGGNEHRAEEDESEANFASEKSVFKRQKLDDTGEFCSTHQEKQHKVAPNFFSSGSTVKFKAGVPLAERMRPATVEEVVGQEHLLGKQCILGSLLQCNQVPSIIFWGPPGTGKTSLAKAIANSVSYRFASISAVSSGLKEVREVMEEAKRRKKFGQRTLFFVDEVHRFNKAQQDAFLPVIEDGTIVFIGATTENPSFEVNNALLSRCRVLTLQKLQPEHIRKLLERAIADTQKGLSVSLKAMLDVVRVHVDEEAMEFLSCASDGDARVALNALEIAASAAAGSPQDESLKTVVEDQGTTAFKKFEGGKEMTAYTPSNISRETMMKKFDEKSVAGGGLVTVTLKHAKEAMQCKNIMYDKTGEEHYNIISALHKSMRGSDADAGLYWLARMLEGGEDPLYIARRLIRFASEDVGLADPSALTQAVACYQACHFLGMPECNTILAQCVAYLSLAPKSVAVYQAIEEAQTLVREKEHQNEPVPLHLRNAPTRLMKELGYGKGYIYPPSQSSPVEQQYLPSSLLGHKFLKWPEQGMDIPIS